MTACSIIWLGCLMVGCCLQVEQTMQPILQHALQHEHDSRNVFRLNLIETMFSSACTSVMLELRLLLLGNRQNMVPKPARARWWSFQKPLRGVKQSIGESWQGCSVYQVRGSTSQWHGIWSGFLLIFSSKKWSVTQWLLQIAFVDPSLNLGICEDANASQSSSRLLRKHLPGPAAASRRREVLIILRSCDIIIGFKWQTAFNSLLPALPGIHRADQDFQSSTGPNGLQPQMRCSQQRLG